MAIPPYLKLRIKPLNVYLFGCPTTLQPIRMDLDPYGFPMVEGILAEHRDLGVYAGSIPARRSLGPVILIIS